ncbi:MAG: hypothetical protein F4150_03040, partial [Chloroflexi bacterium]|nr:hypothetical protein [Chloroflexota bacterium]
MSWALALGSLLGCGLALMLLGQPLGRPRPELSQRLRRLSAEGRLALEEGAAGGSGPMFRSQLLERTLRPLLEDAGRASGALLARLGIEIADLDRRLRLAAPGMSAAQFRGQQLATASVALLAFPAMNLLGAHPLGPWPLWLWLGAAACGFAAPSWQLASRLRARRAAISGELPAALDLLVIAASAGLSPEQSLVEAGRRLRGVLGEALRGVVREAGLGAADESEG